MTERLDKAITSVQDFVLDRMGGVLTELEVADLTKRILTLTNAARVPFEMELIDLGHGVVITIPEQYSVQEVIEIRRSFVELIKSDAPVFICRGGINIQKLHADLVIAARRFVERCYACKGTGVVGEENETPMNCGVCADLRAAVSFFDKHNIPQSQEKDILPSKTPMFRKGDRLLYAVGGTKPENGDPAGFISYVRMAESKAEEGPRADETDEWQPVAKIALDGYVEPQIVSTEKLHPDPSSPTSEIERWGDSRGVLTRSAKKIVKPTTQYKKGDPVLYKGPAYEVQAVFGWYVNENGFGTEYAQPNCVVFMNAHPSQEKSVLTKDLQPWVHSSSSMPPKPPASQDTGVEIAEDGPKPK